MTSNSRIRRLLTRAVLLLALLLVFIRELRDRHDRIIRESLVEFSGNSLTTRSTVEKPVRWFNGTHIDDRYRILRHLKDGGQGSVYLCSDVANNGSQVVVKTISADARNRLPAEVQHSFGEFTDTWPSEIEATLSLASQDLEGHAPFVPVLDYFLIRNIGSATENWQWTMVTPFVSGGTLTDLARRLQDVPQAAEELDQKFRPPFAKIVTDLRGLHEAGYCHDDVKAANVFIEDSQYWILGDLGNTREVSHGWHGTQLWHRRNQWSDCRLNDMRRAIKSFITFLRDASPSEDRAQFDYEFLHGTNPWSQLYWAFVGDPQASYDAAILEYPQGPRLPSSIISGLHRGTLVGDWKRQIVVDQELLCTSLWYKLWLTF